MSKAAVESSSENSLPPPPNSRRWLAIASLLLVALSSYLVVGGLWSAARFALSDAEPQQVGPLKSAALHKSSQWLEGSGRVRGEALSFERRGERGSFRLARAEGRDDLWLLLKVPETLGRPSDFIPPSNFSGRLLPLNDAGIQYAPIARMIENGGHPLDSGFLLLDGEVPQDHRDSLWAAILLALVGTACLSFAARLLVRNP